MVVVGLPVVQLVVVLGVVLGVVLVVVDDDLIGVVVAGCQVFHGFQLCQSCG